MRPDIPISAETATGAIGGHKITLVCLPAEVEAFNSEGAQVRMPIRGRNAPIDLDSRKLPGSLKPPDRAASTATDYDLVVLAMQEPQYRSPGVRELLDAVARAQVPCMSIMNMPPLPYLKRIPGLATDALRACFTDADVWDNFEPGLLTLCSPDPQAIRPPGEKINVLQVTLPTNFKSARFADDGPTGILQQMQADVEAIRYDPGDGPIDLPVKLKVHEFDFRAARQMGDAVDRQLPLCNQGRGDRHQGCGSSRPRGVALGL